MLQKTGNKHALTWSGLEMMKTPKPLGKGALQAKTRAMNAHAMVHSA